MNDKLFEVDENLNIFICRDCQKKVREDHLDCSDDSSIWTPEEWEALKNANS